MISGVRESEIIQCAGDAVRDAGFNTLPIDPRKIAGDSGIELMAWRPEKLGISGFLLRSGEEFGIGYSTAIQNEGFVNFTIAHELGHYFLSGHVETLIGKAGGTHYSASGFVSDNIHEREADMFAAELLMPRHLFKPAMQRAGAGFKAIQNLAETGQTSIVATAIRVAKLSDELVAVILTTGRQIEWCFVSNELRELRGVYPLGKRSVLPATSATARFNCDVGRVERGERVEDFCSLRDWFERAPDVEFQEDVIGLGHYGKTLTVLFTEEVLSDDDNEDDEEDQDAESDLPSSRWRRRDESRWRG